MLASLIIPTHQRPDALQHTLACLEALSLRPLQDAGGVELIIVDNASSPKAAIPRRLANGIPVTPVRLHENRGAAARNDAATLASGQWLVMLDDDSSPIDTAFLSALQHAEHDTAAICADIRLPTQPGQPPRRESGGLPEVPVGCGVAYRRAPYLALGGYDPSFGYYAEEYDLVARLIAQGWRITHNHAFRVEHRKVTTNRNFANILTRLVFNNTAVWQRYAPDQHLSTMLERELARLATIADREGVRSAFNKAIKALPDHLATQPRQPLDQANFDRFTGLAATRAALTAAINEKPFESACLTMPPGPPGKHTEYIEQALIEHNIEPLRAHTASASPPVNHTAPIIPATLAPGPMLSAAEQLRTQYPQRHIILPWNPAPTSTTTANATTRRSKRLAS